jgi:serine/threonine-protein kinase
MPFVSPDGKWVGFWGAGQLRKVSIEGGPVMTIAPVAATAWGPYGAAWGATNAIVFGDERSGRVWRVSASGGTPAPVTAAPEVGHRHVSPRFLPDGTRILFTDLSNADATQGRVMVQPVDPGEVRLVMPSAADARVLSSGHLAFMRLGAVMTVAFDVDRAEAIGEPEVAMNAVMQMGLRGTTGAAHTATGMFDVTERRSRPPCATWTRWSSGPIGSSSRLARGRPRR